MHTSASFPLLSVLLLLLPLASVLLLFIPIHRVRWVVLAAAVLSLVLSLWVVMLFDPSNSGFQLIERYLWIPSLNVHFSFGIDGISVLFLPLTTLLFIAVILASWNRIHTLPRLYFALLLLLECATLGVFLALDTIVFYFFWEMMLIPLYFLISLWGVGADRRYAATKYTLFMMVGGIPLLFAFTLLATNVPGDAYIFDYIELLDHAKHNTNQTLIFFLLLVGFAVKMPLFPLHTWMPIVASEGPTSVVALLAGLKLGVYGLLRFVIPLAPEAAQEFQWLLVGLGTLGIIYGAVAALNQTNIRRMLAFSSISHVSLVVVGIASLSLQGLQGAVYQLLNFTLISSGLFLLTGFLHHRIGSTDRISLGGVAKSMPVLASFFFVLGLASIGMPATSGFPAEILLIMGALSVSQGVGSVALLAVVLGGAYFISTYRHAFLGEAKNIVVADAFDLTKRERWIIFTFILLVIFGGLYPQFVLDMTSATEKAWLAGIGSASN